MVKGNVWMGGWYVTEMRCGGGGGGGGARFEGSEVLRKLTPPRTPHLLRYPTPHQTEGRKKKVQDITLFQPKMRDHRSRRLRALPFFINFIQTNTQGDARDTRTPVPTPKPRGQGGGS